jgi:hypothetical protein
MIIPLTFHKIDFDWAVKLLIHILDKYSGKKKWVTGLIPGKNKTPFEIDLNALP